MDAISTFYHHAGRLLIAALLGLLMTAFPGQSGHAMPTYKVGQILIIGNTITSDRIIRAHVTFYPGQELSEKQLKLTEQNLARLGLFTADPKQGMPPTVTVIEDPNFPDGEFKDILIRVEERQVSRHNIFLNALRLYYSIRVSVWELIGE